MAKKKKTRKKVYAAKPKAASAAVAAAPALVPSQTTLPSRAKPAALADPRWAYVASDVRRIGIFIVLCVLIEAILWYALERTSLGPSVYGLIHL